MIFVGFGCLESFLRRYSHSAIALNLCLSALVMLEAVLACGWAQQGWGPVTVDLPLLIDAAFAAGAAMISFGAVIGKATPGQLVWLLAAQVPVYAATAQVHAGGGRGIGGGGWRHRAGSGREMAALAITHLA